MALELSADTDRRVLKWISDALDEDHELEQFFESIPGFRSSVVVNPQHSPALGTPSQSPYFRECLPQANHPKVYRVCDLHPLFSYDTLMPDI